MKKQILQLLKSLELTGKTYWNISPATGRFLNLLIKERKYKVVLEIGSSNGYSGIWLAEALSLTQGRLHTMESHKKDRFSLGAENFKKSGLKKHITHILGHAPEDIPKKPKNFDMIFLDATKEEYVEYFAAIKNRLKKGGMIIADNLYSHPKALKDFVKAIKSEPGWKVFQINLGTGLLVGIRM